MLIFILCVNFTSKIFLKPAHQESGPVPLSADLRGYLSNRRSESILREENKSPQNLEHVSGIGSLFISNLFVHIGEVFSSGELANSRASLRDSAENKLLAQSSVMVFQDLNAESFICPESYPIALNYNLLANESWLTGRGYRNACAFSGGHQAFGDLLYGSNQWQNYTGDYNDLTAFIPWDTVEGCKEDNFLIPLEKSVALESVVKLINQGTGEQVGFQVESIGLNQLNKRCFSYCQNLLDTYCEKLPPDAYYCQNTLSEAYYRESKYNVRNLKEHYCVCKLKSDVAEYGVSYFNQAIDINSVVSYTGRLKKVSCTNNSLLVNNQ